MASFTQHNTHGTNNKILEEQLSQSVGPGTEESAPFGLVNAGNPSTHLLLIVQPLSRLRTLRRESMMYERVSGWARRAEGRTSGSVGTNARRIQQRNGCTRCA